LSGWSVQDAHNGGATIKGDGGKFDVTRGTLVPGLGRVTNVRQRGSRWIVVTDKGTIVQR